MESAAYNFHELVRTYQVLFLLLDTKSSLCQTHLLMVQVTSLHKSSLLKKEEDKNHKK